MTTKYGKIVQHVYDCKFHCEFVVFKKPNFCDNSARGRIVHIPENVNVQ